MKKILISVICLLMLFTFNVYASDIEPSGLEVDNNSVSYTSKFEMDFTVDGLTYYPFIYSSGDGFRWFVEKVVGPTNCKDGYLYVKNLVTGQIKQLVSRSVKVIRTRGNGGYFIYGNCIFYVSYEDGGIEKIYSSIRNLDEKVLEISDNKLYFCQGDKIVRFDIESRQKNNIIQANNVSKIFVKSAQEIIYDVNGEVHCFDGRQNIDKVITNGYEINRLYFSSVTLNSLPSSISTQLDTNFNSLRSQYPNGSYFTEDGTRCTHHGSGCTYDGFCGCKAYLETIQCVAYGKWASNMYANMSTWDSYVREYIEGYDTNTGFSTDEDVNVYFALCAPGAYVRLTRNINDDNGFHSIFFVNRSSTSITSYECNLYGGCEVSYMTRTFWAFRSFSSASSYITTHGYGAASNAVSYNSSYHKQYCLNSNYCSAYRYEAHYSNSPGSNGTCVACGYTGNILYSFPLE